MSMTSVEFEQVCAEALEHGGDLPMPVRDRVIEDLRLRFDYPGQYVAYLDSYETIGRLRRLRRHLIAHNADLEQVQAAILSHPKQQRPNIVLEFAEPLGEELSTSGALPFR
jgi:hypothetical protein